MKTILFFKTATTGLIAYQEPSGSANQPHLVQLAAILCNAATREVIDTMEVIIKPDGWDIPQESIDIHGVTNEMASKSGIPEDQALNQFLELCGDADRVAFGKAFDQRIIRIATKRYSGESVIDKWAIKDNFQCAMDAAKPFVKIPAKTKGKFKNPKMVEAYEHFFFESYQSGHSAMFDAIACKNIYWSCIDADIS